MLLSLIFDSLIKILWADTLFTLNFTFGINHFPSSAVRENLNTISMFLSSVTLTFVDVAIFSNFSSVPLSLVLRPFSFILCAIGPFHVTNAMLIVIQVITLVDFTRFPVENTKATFLTLNLHAFVGVARGECVLTLTMWNNLVLNLFSLSGVRFSWFEISWLKHWLFF